MTAESNLNNPHVVKTPDIGGLGFDAQWLNDFHHALYVLLDDKGRERYADFGHIEQVAKAYTDGFVTVEIMYRSEKENMAGYRQVCRVKSLLYLTKTMTR